MSARSFPSLLGILFGFLCTFPLLRKRETKAPTDTAELLLQQAQQQLREAQAKNRERAVQAITQKNNFQALADQTEKRISRLTERLQAPDTVLDDQARQALVEQRQKHREALAEMQGPLTSAISTVEAVKIAMQREAEAVQVKVTEALALGASEKQAKIEIALAKARLAQTTNLFVQAREKIRQTKAQRNLINQIVQTVETLNVAASEAEASGSEPLHQKLTSSRDALRDSALNAALWKT